MHLTTVPYKQDYVTYNHVICPQNHRGVCASYTPDDAHIVESLVGEKAHLRTKRCRM